MVPMVSAIHARRRRPRRVSNSTVAMRMLENTKVWPTQRPVSMVSANSKVPIGLSSRSGSRAPSAKNRKSTFGSRKTYRKSQIVAPRCQKIIAGGARSSQHENAATVDALRQCILGDLGLFGR